ncbi:MAG: ABC transporter permease [Alphaproteobacteria bacterium]|nr:ABC transporter permease [Alphaproteobacteria bacterium]MBE8220763.1 ABC transporter permease [Alphaproteobacteria bacterium]
MRYLLPLPIGLCVLALWEAAVHYWQVPRFLLPPPSAIAVALIDNLPLLMAGLWTTLNITLIAFACAVISGVGFATLFTRARFIELAFAPYLVALQVTPVVAIAPLILIWVGFDNINRALIIIAWIIAFFPITASSIQGLRSTNRDLHDMMTLAGAKWWQRLLYLEYPAALPAILAGAKTSGGLALIGAVMAEFVAGSGTSTGLAWRIIEAGNRLEIATMFAALIVLSLLGIVFFYTLSFIEWLLLRRWHDSFQ